MPLTVVPGSGTAGERMPTAEKRPRHEATRGGSIRVLVVDDEPSICRALTMLLEPAGYEVIAVRSGEAAFGIVETQPIDVLLVDLRIPDMRGDTIFEYAAGVQPNLRDSTLFLTGDISDQAFELIAACKCNYMRKPFDIDDLLDAVAALSPVVETMQKSSA